MSAPVIDVAVPDHRALRQAVGENVRIALYSRRVSQAKVGAALGHSQAWVSQRITGKADFVISELYAVADRLGVRIDALLPPTTAAKIPG